MEHQPHYPAYIRHAREPRITFVSDASEWTMDADLHLDGYGDDDRLVDSSGRNFQLTGGEGFSADRQVALVATDHVQTLDDVRSDLAEAVALGLEGVARELALGRIQDAGTVEEAIADTMGTGI